jgi:hypothetical protein
VADADFIFRSASRALNGYLVLIIYTAIKNIKLASKEFF